MALTYAGCVGISRYAHPPSEKFAEIDTAATQQVIEIVPSGENIFKAVITGWSYEKKTWQRIFGPWPAVIGRNGLAPDGEKREGDGRTPSGTYRITRAFGTAKELNTGLDYRQTTGDDVWIDDSASTRYNEWAILPTDAASYERMKRDDGLYDLGAVIEYNTSPVVPGHGSAIFIHIWRDNGNAPTAGCVALDRIRLKRLLKWLRAERSPVIILHE